MATADQFYADPSALLKLYLHEPDSRAMTTWRAKTSGPLAVTLHGRVELVNGVALAAHRGFITAAALQAALAALDDDFEQGRRRLRGPDRAGPVADDRPQTTDHGPQTTDHGLPLGSGCSGGL